MRFLADWIMHRRARRLTSLLHPYLNDAKTIVDLGSGTGHNAEAIRRATGAQVLELDVADIHWVGPPPTLIQPGEVPLDAESASHVLILYVLHYCDEPVKLLREAARVSSANVIVLQTTCERPLAAKLLRVQEFFFGRFGYFLARLAGLVTPGDCPLYPKRYYDRQSLQCLCANAGLSVAQHRTHSPAHWPLHCDLYVLQKATP